MSTAIAGLTVALGVCIGVFAASLLQRQRYAREHEQHLRRMAALRRLANPPTPSQRDRVGYL